MLYQGKFIYEGTADSIMHTDDPRVQHFVNGRCSDEILESLKQKESS